MRGALKMPKKLVKHGNSRAIVVDKAILELLKIDEDTEVELSTDGRSLTITPVGAADERRARLSAISERLMTENDDLLRKLAK